MSLCLCLVLCWNDDDDECRKVNVPRLNGGRVGALATRTPHRPNAIGLSTAKVESVTDKTVLLSGVDLVDGR